MCDLITTERPVPFAPCLWAVAAATAWRTTRGTVDAIRRAHAEWLVSKGPFGMGESGRSGTG
jgi:hypothetical protein